MLCDCHLTLGKEQNQSMGFWVLCFNPYSQTQLRNTAGPVGSSCLTVFHLVAMSIQGCACGAQLFDLWESNPVRFQKCAFSTAQSTDPLPALFSATTWPLEWLTTACESSCHISTIDKMGGHLSRPSCQEQCSLGWRVSQYYLLCC
jgi:hypothetical protein